MRRKKKTKFQKLCIVEHKRLLMAVDALERYRSLISKLMTSDEWGLAPKKDSGLG